MTIVFQKTHQRAFGTTQTYASQAETGIPLSSWRSVARREVFRHAIFAQIGVGYGRSAARVVLRGILQKGDRINTMAAKADNIRANFEKMDFTLTTIGIARIDAMATAGFRILGKGLVPYAHDFD